MSLYALRVKDDATDPGDPSRPHAWAGFVLFARYATAEDAEESRRCGFNRGSQVEVVEVQR